MSDMPAAKSVGRQSTAYHRLTGHVVDRGDVVRIERVAQSEHVGGQAGAERQLAGPRDAVAAGTDRHEGEETGEVQREHRGGERDQGSAFVNTPTRWAVELLLCGHRAQSARARARCASG
jgi:hypothetical protein